MTSRQPKGIPIGGQFAASSHDEASSSLPDYTHKEHTTDFSGVPFDHMGIGEERGAVTDKMPRGLNVEGIRFEGGERIIEVSPEGEHDSLDNYESRALYAASNSHMLASVERRPNYHDWRTKTTSPLYVVTLSLSKKQDDGTYRSSTYEQEFVNPRGIPDRASAILAAAESAVEFEKYTDADDYAAQSDKEHEDAIADHDDLRERAENLRALLGDEDYDFVVFGKNPDTARYETKEPSA